MEKNSEETITYALGIFSIILSFFQPIAGVIIGVIGFIQSKKEEGNLSKKARKYNIIGIILGVILATLSLLLNYYLIAYGANLFS